MFYLILILLSPFVSPKCLSYWKGDTYFPPSVKDDSYCPSIITWPISEVTASQYLINDAIAKSLYTTLYDTFTNETDPSLNLNCMGIAMFSFCAYAYPTCNDDDDKISKTCDWMCNLWNIRCPNQTDMYNRICGATDAKVCSHWRQLVLAGWTMALLVLII